MNVTVFNNQFLALTHGDRAYLVDKKEEGLTYDLCLEIDQLQKRLAEAECPCRNDDDFQGGMGASK